MKQLFFLFVAFVAQPSFSEPIVKFDNDSVQIKVSLPKAKIESEKDLTLTLTVKSTQSRLLEIPKEGLWSYINRGPAFFFIELQRKTKGKYVDVEGHASMDNVPEATIDTIYRNDTRNFPTSIDLLYHYVKGQYRVRVLAAFSSLNKLPDIYSDWFYLECENEIQLSK
jgi:hypothetical protein